jgi:hypothetical protein
MFVQAKSIGGESTTTIVKYPINRRNLPFAMQSKGMQNKRYEQNRGDMEDWDSSREGSHSVSPLATTGKRKPSECDRQPESPPEVERRNAPNNWHREKHFRNHQDQMDTDSPASYPKHVMVPSSDSNQRYSHGNTPPSYRDTQSSKGKVITPVLTHEQGGMQGGYEHPMYRPSSYYQGQGHGHSERSNNGHYHGQTPPRHSRHYAPEMDTPPHYGPPPGQEAFIRPRRWACDYCSMATFVSYEEACAHEDACARQYHERYGGQPHHSRGPIPQYDRPNPHGAGGMGALYHASQEVAGPRQSMWSSRGPPIPSLPHDAHHQPHHHHHQPNHHHQPHGYQTPPRYQGYRGYEGRDASAHVSRHDPYRKPQKRMLLARPTDSDSLSDRQCYVRSEMVEIFAASGKDVAARHSKGAQKLVEGQVGIRCVHCSHLRPRDRAERAVCYPSSISRIYQTVADMQRFHFEQCREIPSEVRKIYKTLKTTRPRGVGSPQTYWIQSATLLDLCDTEGGIRFNTPTAKAEPSV